MDMERLIEKFISSPNSKSHRRSRHLEGDGGCEILEELFEILGWGNTGFRFGSPIESFLSDNPGAQEALVNWIIECESSEWKQALSAFVDEDEDDEVDEDDEDDEEDEEDEDD